MNNNYRFFKRDNESSIYDAINKIDIHINNKSMESIPIFPFFVSIREILLCINIPSPIDEIEFTFNSNKWNKTNSTDISDFENRIYNSILVFIFNEGNLSVKIVKEN